MYAIKYFGMDYPYWYNVGCMKTESWCRSNLVSFDGGVSLYQLTPSTGVVKDIEKGLGRKINPYNLNDNIEGFTFYIHRLWSKNMEAGTITFRNTRLYPGYYKNKCGKRLADMFQRYNSGVWHLYEVSKADYCCDRNQAFEKCTRGGVVVGKQYISFCEVSYSYPVKVDKFSLPYKLFSDKKQWRFW
jgi:hypothetical protein